MIKLTVDAELQRKLTEAGQPLEICDQAGRLIGYFQPKPTADELIKMSPYTEEELEELCEQRDGRPLSEIWRDLEGKSRS